MWITVARSNDVKVQYNAQLHRSVLLTNGRHPCYAPTPQEVIYFEDRPHIYDDLANKVKSFRSGYRIKG